VDFSIQQMTVGLLLESSLMVRHNMSHLCYKIWTVILTYPLLQMVGI
jgi:hypothetical protein